MATSNGTVPPMLEMATMMLVAEHSLLRPDGITCFKMQTHARRICLRGNPRSIFSRLIDVAAQSACSREGGRQSARRHCRIRAIRRAACAHAFYRGTNPDTGRYGRRHVNLSAVPAGRRTVLTAAPNWITMKLTRPMRLAQGSGNVPFAVHRLERPIWWDDETSL